MLCRERREISLISIYQISVNGNFFYPPFEAVYFIIPVLELNYSCFIIIPSWLWNYHNPSHNS